MSPEKAKALGAKLTGNKTTISASATKMSATPATPVAPAVVRDPGMLNLQNVAGELGYNSPLWVARLIARRRLGATRLGGEHWRVLASNLAAYVSSGAKDYAIPAIKGDWFDHDDTRPGEGFPTAILEAAADQKIDQDEAQRLFDQRRIAEPRIVPQTIEVAIRITPAVREVINRPVPVSPFTPKSQRKVSRFRRWADMYLVGEIRKEAYKLLNPIPNAKPSLERFYAGPTEYKSIIEPAIANVLNRPVALSSIYRVEHKPFGTQEVRVVQVLKNLAFASVSAEALAELAF